MLLFIDTEPSVIKSKVNDIVAEQSFNFSLSVGLATSTHHKKLGELISSADTALYKAIDSGKS